MTALRQFLAISLVAGALCHDALHGQVLPFQSYVVRDGLPSNYITALCQDSRGYLWIGTDNGLSVYDGTEFKNFTTTDGLPNLFITDIIEQRGKSGAMWLGTIAGGIVRFERGAFSGVPIGDNNVVAMHEDSKGTLWCSTRDRVFNIRNDSVTVFVNVPGGGYDIQSIGDSVVVFLSRSDILFYHLQKHTVGKLHLGLVTNEFSSPMLIDRDGVVWMVTSSRRLAKVSPDGISFQQLSAAFALSEDLPSRIIDDGRGALWVTLPKGILRIDKATFESTIIQEPGRDHTILSGPILIDHEENIWIGTTGEGLLKLTDQRILSISLGPVSTGLANFSATSDTNGHIWVSTHTGLWEVHRSRTGEWKKHHHYSSPEDYGIVVDPKGQLWSLEATKGQYHKYRIIPQGDSPSQLQHIGSVSIRPLVDAFPVLPFVIDGNDRGWFAISPVELVEIDTRHSRVLRRFSPSAATGLLDDTPRAILVDHQGIVWSGTWTAGLNVLHPGTDTFRTVLEYPALSGSGVRSLYQDRDGTVWIGTRYGGVVRYQGGKFTGLSVKDGLLSNAIWCIAETESRIWLGTDVGLESVSKTTGGLLSRKNDLVGQRVYACGAYRNEYVWGVLAHSLVIFHEPEAHTPAVPPPVHIKSFRINGTMFAPESLHEFTYDQNSVAVEFVGLSFKDEKAVRYQYRMVGLDTAWTAPSPHHSVSFASLAPGSYHFEVRAINVNGIPSTTPASIHFIIVPPVWQRWWFVGLVALAVTLVLVLLYRYRVARLLEMEQLRTHIAADLHDDVGTNLSSIMLASQIIERELPPLSRERRHLTELRSRAGVTQEMLKDIVWLLNPRNDTIGDFILKLKEIARRQLMDIQCTFNVSGEQLVHGLSLDFKRNVVLFLKEAVTNVAKHAEATSVIIDLTLAESTFSLGIHDNGKGFRVDDKSVAPVGGATSLTRGNGLTNLRTRAQHIGGSVEIVSAPGSGTTVRLVSTMAYTRSTARRKKFID